MLLLNALEFNLPLKNPVLIFSLILFIVLFVPILLNRVKIPPLIGLIIAGALIGPFGFNLMLRDSSVTLFGTVGLLYIMFMAGLEIDLIQFKKNSGKSVILGLYTFIFPMLIGTAVTYYVLHFSLMTSVLLASMFASHTLIVYPLLSKLGVAQNRAVTVTVGATMITDTLALLVLAAVAGMSTGEINNEFWIRLGIGVLLFALIVLFLFPIIGRWFFKINQESVSQYIFVLGMVFLAGFLAEVAGIEPIIGAFLAGLALNRLIPHTSALMNRIEFVGNALFIPFFLIGIGMLIDYRVFIKDWETLEVAAVMILCAMSSKYLACWLGQKTFGYTADERRIMFSLSNAQAAATLATVLVGYNIILGTDESGQPIRLLNEYVLNGTILMILVSCTIASFAAQKGGRNIALLEAEEQLDGNVLESEKILIPLLSENQIDELIQLSISIKSKKNTKGFYGLSVLGNSPTEVSNEKAAKKILDHAVQSAAATDHTLQPVLRYDSGTSQAIISVIQEQKISDILLGFTAGEGIEKVFPKELVEEILESSQATLFIYRPTQPLTTIKRQILVVPPNAETEAGFALWLIRVWSLARNTGTKLLVYGHENSLKFFRDLQVKHPVDIQFETFTNWDDFLLFSREVKQDDLFTVIMSRRLHRSYQSAMMRVPGLIEQYFKSNSVLLIFPIQGISSNLNDSGFRDLNMMPSVTENLLRLDEIGKTVLGIFKRNK